MGEADCIGQRRRWEHHRATAVPLSATCDTSLVPPEKETTSIASNGSDAKEFRATVFTGRRHAVTAPPVVAPGVAWVSGSAEVSGLDLGHLDGQLSGEGASRKLQSCVRSITKKGEHI